MQCPNLILGTLIKTCNFVTFYWVLSHLCMHHTNCCMWWCRGEGTMVAIVQWRPLWLGCVFLPSFCLSNCVSDVHQPQNHPKTNHCPTSYLRQQWSDRDISSTHLVRMHGRKTQAIWIKGSFIFGAAVPVEASETMVELFLWPSIVLCIN